MARVVAHAASGSRGETDAHLVRAVGQAAGRRRRERGRTVTSAPSRASWPRATSRRGSARSARCPRARATRCPAASAVMRSRATSSSRSTGAGQRRRSGRPARPGSRPPPPSVAGAAQPAVELELLRLLGHVVVGQVGVDRQVDDRLRPRPDRLARARAPPSAPRPPRTAGACTGRSRPPPGGRAARRRGCCPRRGSRGRTARSGSRRPARTR